MRKLLVLAMLVGLISGYGGLAIAEDGHNVPDQLGDIFSGKGDTYGGVEIINIPLPIVKALTLTAWADAMVGEIDEGVERDVRGGVRIVLDWQKLIK